MTLAQAEKGENLLIPVLTNPKRGKKRNVFALWRV